MSNIKEIEKNPDHIRFLEEPTIKEQMAAVKGDIDIVKSYKKFDDEVYDYVVDRKPDYIKYVKHPSKKAIKRAIHHDPLSIGKLFINDRETVEEAVKLNSYAILFSPFLNDESMQLLAYDKELYSKSRVKDGFYFGCLFKYFANPSTKVITVAMANDTWAFRYVKEEDRTPAMIDYAVKNCYPNIEYVKDPSRDLIKFAIKKDPDIIKLPNINKRLSEGLVMYAIKSSKFYKDYKKKEPFDGKEPKHLLDYIPHKFFNDKVIIECIKKDPYTLDYYTEYGRTADMIKEAVTGNHEVASILNKNDDIDAIASVLKDDPSIAIYLDFNSDELTDKLIKDNNIRALFALKKPPRQRFLNMLAKIKPYNIEGMRDIDFDDDDDEEDKYKGFSVGWTDKGIEPLHKMVDRAGHGFRRGFLW